ncbi:uncharacterized protein PAC_02263 [Phialocephala subalpina]|uniref:Uncharacterized protein n=1 Tax=Phialocephala subalpina TaxID=576137 RepID=A0A1L7WHY8_9HELO|nr:uncharacterized protein PAC_02263 [Phialocephala subalpina]
MPNVRLRPCFSLDCVETLEEYASYVLDQDTILKQLEHHLSQVIAAFPKLSTIIICNTHMHSSERFMSVLQRNSISRKWVRKNQFMALLRAIADTPSCNITRITVEGHWIEKAFRFLNNGNFGDDHETLGSIQYCLGPAFMTASYPKEKIPFMHGSSFSLNAQELLTAKSIFSNLTQLKLGIFTAVPLEEFYMDPADVAKTYWAEFPKVLQSLTKVVDLSLDMKIHRAVDQQHSCDYYHDDIAELFENRSITFPYLKRLKLSQFRSRGSSVNAFLERHPNIVDLTLNFIIQIKTEYNPWDDRWAVWTPDPQWIQCVETMNALKLHRLDLRGIEGFGCDYSRYGSENENLTLARIHDYVLHGYGDNPLPTRLPLKENGLSWDREFWYTDDECMSS